MEKLLTETEAAELLGMKAAGLRTMRVNKRGPEHLRIGRLVRYSPETVAAWAAAQAQDPEETAE